MDNINMENSSGKTQNVLVVEDSTLQAKMITDLLTEHQINSEVAVSGAIAIEKALTGKFNLILLDMVLPDTSGLNLLAQLRRSTHTKELPIIMLSGVTDKENVVQALSQGVNDYVTKPFHPQELITRINIQLTLQKNVEELRQHNANKAKIFAVLAHDIKSPFNGLLGFAEILTQEGLLEDKRKKYISSVYNSAKTIYSLLDNVLIWMGMQSGGLKPALKNLSLSEVMTEMLELYLPIAHEKGLTIVNNSKEEVTVLADSNMFNAILRNLLNNAIKFTPAGGIITITGVNNNGSAEITVNDTGIGIAAEDMPTLFSFDNNMRPGTNGEKGTGLGLLLCHDFAEANGGEISVESTVGVGSTFKVRLPK